MAGEFLQHAAQSFLGAIHLGKLDLAVGDAEHRIRHLVALRILSNQLLLGVDGSLVVLQRELRAAQPQQSIRRLSGAWIGLQEFVVCIKGVPELA